MLYSTLPAKADDKTYQELLLKLQPLFELPEDEIDDYLSLQSPKVARLLKLFYLESHQDHLLGKGLIPFLNGEIETISEIDRSTHPATVVTSKIWRLPSDLWSGKSFISQTGDIVPEKLEIGIIGTRYFENQSEKGILLHGEVAKILLNLISRMDQKQSGGQKLSRKDILKGTGIKDYMAAFDRIEVSINSIPLEYRQMKFLRPNRNTKDTHYTFGFAETAEEYRARVNPRSSINVPTPQSASPDVTLVSDDSTPDTYSEMEDLHETTEAPTPAYLNALISQIIACLPEEIKTYYNIKNYKDHIALPREDYITLRNEILAHPRFVLNQVIRVLKKQFKAYLADPEAQSPESVQVFSSLAHINVDRMEILASHLNRRLKLQINRDGTYELDPSGLDINVLIARDNRESLAKPDHLTEGARLNRLRSADFDIIEHLDGIVTKILSAKKTYFNADDLWNMFQLKTARLRLLANQRRVFEMADLDVERDNRILVGRIMYVDEFQETLHKDLITALDRLIGERMKVISSRPKSVDTTSSVAV